MLYVNPGHAPRFEVHPGERAEAELDGAPWIDLLKPDEAERAMVQRATGLRVPTQPELEEVESSSRLSRENGVLYLSSPMYYLDRNGVPHSGPIGFVLSAERLLTIRFGSAPVCDEFAGHFAHDPGRASSVGAFLGLLEAIIDRLADVLERIGAELDVISRRIFRPESIEPRGRRVARTDQQLRASLRSIGRAGERLSNLRDGLLGIQRIAGYVGEGSGLIPSEERPRLVTLKQDIVSLTDYDVQLANKVQFLLDATLGFISIEQNNGIKILTVVSVVGVPPTLVASIYGMNFKWIPELDWGYGYFYALTLVVLSALVPLWWFKRRGWI